MHLRVRTGIGTALPIPGAPGKSGRITSVKTALVIGGGFAGCAAAHQLALQGGWDVTLVEVLPFLGAGVRTQYCGGHPYTYGPRHFLTPMVHIYEYLHKYVPLRRCGDHQ